MELNSMENIRLFRNCIAIEKAIPGTNPDVIDSYNNLFNLMVNSSNPEDVLASQTGEAANLGNYIISTPEPNILDDYINLAKTYINNPEDFERFENAMNFNRNIPSTKDLNELLELASKQLDHIFRANKPQTMSPTQFKDFSLKFKNVVKTVAQTKFQEFFSEKEQIISHMSISDDDRNYKIDLTLLDKEHQKTNSTFTETMPSIPYNATPIQNLCYSYLEADKFANTPTELITQAIIHQQMHVFSECREKLEPMLNYIKINILGNRLIVSGFSDFSPQNIPEKEEVDTEEELSI